MESQREDVDLCAIQNNPVMTPDAYKYLQKELGKDFGEIIFFADTIDLETAKEYMKWYNNIYLPTIEKLESAKYN